LRYQKNFLNFTGSIARSAYDIWITQGAILIFFRPAGKTRCTDGVNFGVDSSTLNFTQLVQGWGRGAPKLKSQLGVQHGIRQQQAHR